MHEECNKFPLDSNYYKIVNNKLLFKGKPLSKSTRNSHDQRIHKCVVHSHMNWNFDLCKFTKLSSTDINIFCFSFFSHRELIFF